MGTGAADSWYHEKESAWLYGVVAAAEPDPAQARVVRQARRRRRRSGRSLARHVDPRHSNRFSLPRCARASWRSCVRRIGPRRLRARARRHEAARPVGVFELRRAPASHAIPTTVAEVGKRHASAGGKLRAAVFGASDGLVSNASLVMGVAAAGSDLHSVQIAGTAGLLAGALSMAAGEYVSVRSQREFYEHQMALERKELAEYPEAEAEELALIYNARGIDMDEARRISAMLLSRPEHALDVLAREELGLNPDDLGSPSAAAGIFVRRIRDRRAVFR